MHRIFLFTVIIATFLSQNALCQNLIPNGDFEQYSNCPIQYGAIDSALFWFNPTIGGLNGSPDYFNICSANSGIHTPGNYYGYQPPASGVAYAGILLYNANPPNAREYIEVPLTTPLINGIPYHFEMFVNLANTCRFTTDAIQVYFSDTAVTGFPTFAPLPFTPQLINTSGNKPDTLNWTFVSGDYTAHGGENFLIIGNFNTDANTNTTLVQGSGSPFSYCYIDDVSLTYISGISESSDFAVSVYPNPVTNELMIKTNGNNKNELTIYDVSSRTVMHKYFINKTSIRTDMLMKGVYFYKVKFGDGIIRTGRFVKS